MQVVLRAGQVIDIVVICDQRDINIAFGHPVAKILNAGINHLGAPCVCEGGGLL